MPNAIGNLIAQSDLKDLGVHTEMYVDAFVDIAKAGKITGRHKNLDKGRQVYAFGAGTQKMYDYLNDNPECMAAPVEYTNDIRSISAIDNFISINNAVDIDLFGQVNAESAGIKHISGAGGQLDFVLGAYLSNGGKSFICLSSTFMNKKTGKLISNVPFSVTITDPNGKTETWTDDDMDGIIYKKGITPGNYSVAVNALTDDKYKDYVLPTAAQKVEVKKDIAYKKVDVSNEIKKESEINAAKEDTQIKDTTVESTLQDTVQWVASTATANTYKEVSKDTCLLYTSDAADE